MCVLIKLVETVRLANGVDLQYRESGDPNGKPVILLHGVTDSLHCWKPFADALPSAYRTIALSQRGHGDSSKPDDCYGAEAFAGDLAAFMDALQILRAHIVGHSMSTWIVQSFARNYPDRIDSVTLIAGFATLAGNAAVEGLIRDIDAMGETVERDFVRAFQESTVATPLPPAYLDMVVAESLKVPARVWRAAFAAMASEQTDARKIDCRALLIGCGKDELFDDNGRLALARAFSNAREIFYPDLGHAPHWEQPARVARELAAFIG